MPACNPSLGSGREYHKPSWEVVLADATAPVPCPYSWVCPSAMEGGAGSHGRSRWALGRTHPGGSGPSSPERAGGGWVGRVCAGAPARGRVDDLSVCVCAQVGVCLCTSAGASPWGPIVSRVPRNTLWWPPVTTHACAGAYPWVSWPMVLGQTIKLPIGKTASALPMSGHEMTPSARKEVGIVDGGPDP